MAMTKKERAEFDAAIHQAKLFAALRWTEAVPPDVLIPTYPQPLSRGFIFNAHTRRVEIACSSSANHGIGSNDKTTTQGAKKLYSKRLLALKALRHEVEMQSAATLLQIDEAIAAAARPQEPAAPGEQP